jgi:hypothetical protein
VFPADNPWNREVIDDPVDPGSAQYLTGMKASGSFLRANFRGDGNSGIPVVVVPGSQPRMPIAFDIPNESDPGPYPIPADPAIEMGVDRHLLVLDRDNCFLYETWNTRRSSAGWLAGSGAVFDLRSNTLRPPGWTSADGAGLPILPGLIRYDEVKAGRIEHALRFSIASTQRAYVPPARHFTGTAINPDLPPMGLRVRLAAGYDISAFGPTARVVLTALKKYGMFLADNGGDWLLTGESNPAWNDGELAELARVPASAFEVVAHGAVTR